MLRLVCCVFFLSSLLVSQDRWAFRSLVQSPRATSPAMAYDAKRGETVLVLTRSLTSKAEEAETWVWNGTVWSLRVPLTTAPLPLAHQAMTYDEDRGVVVLHGGEPTNNTNNSMHRFLWEWDGADWKLATPILWRSRHAIVYDGARKQTLLFGGFGLPQPNKPGVLMSDTQTWDGKAWSQLNPVSSPGPREHHAMAYDPKRQRVVLFGGLAASGPMDDTWEWDGKNWTQITVSNKPSARHGHAMSWEGQSGMVMLFGGKSANGYMQDSWAFDGKNWTTVTTPSSPAQRAHHGMVYDDKHSVLVLYGGNNGSWLRDTWEFISASRPGFTISGTGCAGSGGKVPTIGMIGELKLGSTNFAVTLSNAKGGPGSAFFALGANTANVQFGGGCGLLVTPDLLLLLPVIGFPGPGNGSSILKLPIPNNARLKGASVHCQWGVVDPAAAGIGIAFTKGAKLGL